MIRFGPAGWTYPDSPGHIYPADTPKKFDVLAFLANYYTTIEINASFYAPQPPRNYASWARRVTHNPDFRFTAKLWQKFTHGTGAQDAPGARAAWTEADVREVTDGLDVLRQSKLLGAVLAQFPWSFKPSTASHELLTRLAEDFRGYPMVVELRHGSWAEREHALLLKRLGLGFCNIDQPVIGDSLGPTAGATSDTGYVRLHGRRYDAWFEERASTNDRYDYLYTADELKPWAERVRKIANAEEVKDVYVVANNHFEGKGPANALMLDAMVNDRKVKAPPQLFETYREHLAPWSVPATP